MPEFKEITAQKILSVTGIKEARYVINPYRGCQFGCCFCYAQWNKFVQKQSGKWGDFVHIKTNAPKILAKELQQDVHGTVMLGSTTEIYQPVESKYKLTRQILNTLKEKNLNIIILTRSDLITRDIDILKKLKKVLICFTLNTLDNEVIKAFEKGSPSADKRVTAIKNLAETGIPVYLHVGPFLPFLTDPEKLLNQFDGFVERVDFENLNLKMISRSHLNEILTNRFPHLIKDYENIYRSEESFDKYWHNVRSYLETLQHKFNMKINIKFHPFDSFFQSYVSK